MVLCTVPAFDTLPKQLKAGTPSNTHFGLAQAYTADFLAALMTIACGHGTNVEFPCARLQSCLPVGCLSALCCLHSVV
jgi:hypothetical protein